MAKKKPAPKRGASRYQAPAAKNGVPGWVWLVAGLAIGGFIMFLMKLEPGRKDVQRERPDAQRPAAVQGKQPQQNGQAQQPAQTQTPAQAKPKYEFYTLLPESEVVVPPEAVPEKAPPPPTPAELAKADETRAKAALAGRRQHAVLPAGRLVPQAVRRRPRARADHPARAVGERRGRQRPRRDLVPGDGRPVQQPRPVVPGAEDTVLQRLQQPAVTATQGPLNAGHAVRSDARRCVRLKSRGSPLYLPAFRAFGPAVWRFPP